jgi:hypothetical protein
MFRTKRTNTRLFVWRMNVRSREKPAVASRLFQSIRLKYAGQQVALPQRAMPTFSLRPSMPMAPTTTCLPMT